MFERPAEEAKVKKWFCVFALLFLFGACKERMPETVPQVVAEDGALPKVYVRWDMPHLDQADYRIKAYHYDISALCAPTASANALVWLAKNGKPNIKYDNPYSLIGEMAQKARTIGGGVGTNFRLLTDQMVKFIREYGYDCTYEQMGSEWSKNDGEHYTFKQIDYELLKKSLLDKNKVALIQIRLCHYNLKSNTYITSSGHLLTLAGYDDQKENLIIADPNYGSNLRHYSFKLVEHQDGLLTDNHVEVCKTAGLYKIAHEDSVTTDIITGAAIFTVN